jgi:hypothetical protein
MRWFELKAPMHVISIDDRVMAVAVAGQNAQLINYY